MNIAYVVWRDASHGLEEIRPAEGELAELHEIGFIWHEDEDRITLSLEYQDGAETARNWLSIPRQNILQIVRFRLDELLGLTHKPKRGRRAG